MSVFALRKAMPLAPAAWLDALVVGAPRWGINTEVRLAAFAGHLAHESEQFTRLEERLNYSPERLMAVWPRRFPTMDVAKQYAHNPAKLANKVYAGRVGNGDEASNDGYTFRGRGPIQVTFRANYLKYGTMIDVDLVAEPGKLLFPAVGIAAAGAYWQSHGLNELADEGDAGLVRQVLLSPLELDDELAITKAINGGSLGFTDRVNWIQKIRKELV